MGSLISVLLLAGGSVSHAGIVINEFFPNPAGGDSGAEWVELYNNGGSAVDLNGYSIEAGTSSYSEKYTFSMVYSLAPGEWVTVADEGFTGADFTIASGNFGLGNAGTNSDSIRLKDDSGDVIDTVVYGTPNTDEWTNDAEAIATSLAPEPVEGGSIGRSADGVDSNASAADFSTFDFATLGSTNTPSGDCGGSAHTIVINEFLPDPVDDDDGYEWIELYNSGDSTVDLDGWTVRTATSADNFSTKFEFDSTSLSPGGFIVAGGIYVPEADLTDASFNLPNGTNGDSVRIVDCLGSVSDTVAYGSSNDDEVPDDRTDIASDLAADPPSGSSLQRRVDGVDSDVCDDDFALQDDPTPGEPNPVIEIDPCVATAGTVKINELFPDPNGVDEGQEWFELYNSHTEAVSLSGWFLSTALNADGIGEVDIELPSGTSIAAEGFLVVGGSVAESVDLVKTFAMGNGDAGDALQLYDCEGALVDTVIYGDSNADELVDDLGDVPTDAYVDPINLAIERRFDGVDSDGADDWVVTSEPSPGQSNGQLEYEDTDVVGGGGCSGPPEEPGCTHHSGRTGLLFLGALALIFRRRRS